MLILLIELQNDYKTIKLDSPKTAWCLDYKLNYVFWGGFVFRQKCVVVCFLFTYFVSFFYLNACIFYWNVLYYNLITTKLYGSDKHSEIGEVWLCILLFYRCLVRLSGFV